VRIYRRRRERFADGCVKETDRLGGSGVLLRIPGVRLAVSTAVTQRLRKWISVMCLS
jgi:hypothetical protein